MKKGTTLQCTVYNLDGKIMESYRYCTTISDKQMQYKQAENDVKLKHDGKFSRITLIEVIEEKPHQITDNLIQKGQSYSNIK